MGVVYKARQTGLNRLVALKMIRGGSQARPDHFARFRIEAEAVARLRHPNIVQIYDIGEVDGLPFVSLELLEGGALADRLAGTPQPGRPAAELMVTLARAVQVAHEAGIVHRDLKPSNVLFTEDGIPKITDFGLAKRLESDSRQTETGQIMGTPSYMAPEQARGHTKDVGPGRRRLRPGGDPLRDAHRPAPVQGRDPDGDGPPGDRRRGRAPLAPRPQVAADLETICLKCLDKEPSRRYASAAALADDLRALSQRRDDPGPAHARSGSAGSSGPAAGRPRPPCSGLGLALFLGLTVGASGWSAGSWQRNRRVDRAPAREGQLIDAARDATDPGRALPRSRLDLSNFLGELKRRDGLAARGPARADRGLAGPGRTAARDWTSASSSSAPSWRSRRATSPRQQRFRTFLRRCGRRPSSTRPSSSSAPATARAAPGPAREALAVYARDPKATDEAGAWPSRCPRPRPTPRSAGSPTAATTCC